MNLLVYSHSLSPRLRYIFKQIFNNILKVDVLFTQNKEYFINSDAPKISYTHKKISDELFFKSTDLLFQKSILDQDLTISEYNSVPCFYTCEGSCLPFDPFASSFFMLSRYEEYLPQIKDKFGRFEAKESFAFKNNFLQKPIVDIWSNFIKEEVLKRYSNFLFPKKSFRFLNTIDIDNAYAYLEKGFLRNIGGFLRDFVQKKDPLNRLKVLCRLKKDPYDKFNEILCLHKEYNLNTTFFFLLADYGFNDKNVPVTSQKLIEQIKEVSDYCNVGLHTSFASLSKKEKLIIELNRMVNILHTEVIEARQHFIKLNMPKMYRNLLKCGVKNDFSMGFASSPGFRAGTCNPYFFYDLDLENETDLTIHPFSIMDVTLNDYMNLSSSESLSLIKCIINEVKNVNGQFISIWHNESLNFKGRWLGWENVYKDMIKYAIKQ